MTKTHLRLAYFSRSVVAAVAETEGIFARQGLRVEAVPVTSSPHQFGLLRDGGCDLALSSPDNVAAYGLSAANPLGERLDVRMVLGLDAGLGLSVLAGPSGVTSLEQLRGRTVGVDVPQSGFALALFGVLRSVAGLEAGRDFEVATLGATPARRAALVAGACDATLLNAGHDIAAEQAGCHRLARVTEHYHPYLGAVLVATGPWLAGHADATRRFAAAWLDAVALVRGPDGHGAAAAAAGSALDLAPEAAGAFVQLLRSERDGLIGDGRIDRAGLATVLRLRGLAPDAADALVDPLSAELVAAGGTRPAGAEVW